MKGKKYRIDGVRLTWSDRVSSERFADALEKASGYASPSFGTENPAGGVRHVYYAARKKVRGFDLVVGTVLRISTDSSYVVSRQSESDDDPAMEVIRREHLQGDKGTEVGYFALCLASGKGLEFGPGLTLSSLRPFLRKAFGVAKRLTVTELTDAEVKREMQKLASLESGEDATSDTSTRVSRREIRSAANKALGDLMVTLLTTKRDIDNLAKRFESIKEIEVRSPDVINEESWAAKLLPRATLVAERVRLDDKASRNVAIEAMRRAASFRSWGEKDVLRVLGRAADGEALDLVLGDNLVGFGTVSREDYLKMLIADTGSFEHSPSVLYLERVITQQQKEYFSER